MTRVLNCKSLNTALSSLCEMFSCDQGRFKEVVDSIDLEEIYERDGRIIEVSAEDFLFNYFVENLGEPINFDLIHWFHATRVVKGSKFESGIVPLHKVLPELWKMMVDLGGNLNIRTNIIDMMNNGVPNDHYENKSNDPIHSGPYGVLVRETHFNTEDLSLVNYLGMPEIIEDICDGYKSKFGESILELYEEGLEPCIVEFQGQAGKRNEDATKVALCYVYYKMRYDELNTLSVTCFDGENSTVEYSDIVSIEYIKP